MVLVPGGLGDGAPQVGQPGYQALAEQGFVVISFNAPGRGTDQPGNLVSGGVEDCNGFAGQNALKAVIEYTAGLSNVDTANIGVQINSYGITMGAGTLGRYPDLPVRYLVDMEGPSNNLISTLYYTGQENNHLCGHWSVISDTSQANLDWWHEREAYRYIGDFTGYYLRAQATIDHAQPPGIYTHTLEMNNVAVAITWTYASTRSDALAWPRDADRLDNGNSLITDSNNDRIIEVTPNGDVVWQYAAGLKAPYDADRLTGGNTLIADSGNARVIEVNQAGRITWEYPPVARLHHTTSWAATQSVGHSQTQRPTVH